MLKRKPPLTKKVLQRTSSSSSVTKKSKMPKVPTTTKTISPPKNRRSSSSNDKNSWPLSVIDPPTKNAEFSSTSHHPPSTNDLDTAFLLRNDEQDDDSGANHHHIEKNIMDETFSSSAQQQQQHRQQKKLTNAELLFMLSSSDQNEKALENNTNSPSLTMMMSKLLQSRILLSQQQKLSSNSPTLKNEGALAERALRILFKREARTEKIKTIMTKNSKKKSSHQRPAVLLLEDSSSRQHQDADSVICHYLRHHRPDWLCYVLAFGLKFPSACRRSPSSSSTSSFIDAEHRALKYIAAVRSASPSAVGGDSSSSSYLDPDTEHLLNLYKIIKNETQIRPSPLRLGLQLWLTGVESIDQCTFDLMPRYLLKQGLRQQFKISSEKENEIFKNSPSTTTTTTTTTTTLTDFAPKTTIVKNIFSESEWRNLFDSVYDAINSVERKNNNNNKTNIKNQIDDAQEALSYTEDIRKEVIDEYLKIVFAYYTNPDDKMCQNVMTSASTVESFARLIIKVEMMQRNNSSSSLSLREKSRIEEDIQFYFAKLLSLSSYNNTTGSILLSSSAPTNNQVMNDDEDDEYQDPYSSSTATQNWTNKIRLEEVLAKVILVEFSYSSSSSSSSPPWFILGASLTAPVSVTRHLPATSLLIAKNAALVGRWREALMQITNTTYHDVKIFNENNNTTNDEKENSDSTSKDNNIAHHHENWKKQKMWNRYDVSATRELLLSTAVTVARMVSYEKRSLFSHHQPNSINHNNNNNNNPFSFSVIYSNLCRHLGAFFSATQTTSNNNNQRDTKQLEEKFNRECDEILLRPSLQQQCAVSSPPPPSWVQVLSTFDRHFGGHNFPQSGYVFTRPGVASLQKLCFAPIDVLEKYSRSLQSPMLAAVTLGVKYLRHNNNVNQTSSSLLSNILRGSEVLLFLARFHLNSYHSPSSSLSSSSSVMMLKRGMLPPQLVEFTLRRCLEILKAESQNEKRDENALLMSREFCGNIRKLHWLFLKQKQESSSSSSSIVSDSAREVIDKARGKLRLRFAAVLLFDLCQMMKLNLDPRVRKDFIKYALLSSSTSTSCDIDSGNTIITAATTQEKNEESFVSFDDDDHEHENQNPNQATSTPSSPVSQSDVLRANRALHSTALNVFRTLNAVANTNEDMRDIATMLIRETKRYTNANTTNNNNNRNIGASCWQKALELILHPYHRRYVSAPHLPKILWYEALLTASTANIVETTTRNNDNDDNEKKKDYLRLRRNDEDCWRDALVLISEAIEAEKVTHKKLKKSDDDIHHGCSKNKYSSSSSSDINRAVIGDEFAYRCIRSKMPIRLMREIFLGEQKYYHHHQDETSRKNEQFRNPDVLLSPIGKEMLVKYGVIDEYHHHPHYQVTDSGKPRPVPPSSPPPPPPQPKMK